MPNPTAVPSRQVADSDAAVLVLNLGTPTAPTAGAVRRYLAQFLSDTRVIDYPRWLWWPILHGIILRLRPRRSAHAYTKIWMPQGSPLLVNSQALVDKLGSTCADKGWRVELGMRYGTPSIPAVIERLVAAGVRRLLVLPLYPQYSATTTASAMDGVFTALANTRRIPELRSVSDYHLVPEYISALAASVEKYWKLQGRGERLLLSFHGIPQRYVNAGDPYRDQCLATAHALRQRLGLTEAGMMVTFQSRVGGERWLDPYTDTTLEQLGADGVRHVQVLCPGFAVDCLETLEEIAIRGREQFLGAGGERLDYIPALNHSAAHVQLMCSLIARYTQGWTEVDTAARD